jgi:hypothetical protein
LEALRAGALGMGFSTYKYAVISTSSGSAGKS